MKYKTPKSENRAWSLTRGVTGQSDPLKIISKTTDAITLSSGSISMFELFSVNSAIWARSFCFFESSQVLKLRTF